MTQVPCLLANRTDQSVVFARLQELIWPTAHSVYDVVTAEVAVDVCSLLTRAQASSKPLLLDCRRVRRVMSHALKAVADYLKQNTGACIGFAGFSLRPSLDDKNLENEISSQLNDCGKIIVEYEEGRCVLFGQRPEDARVISKTWLDDTNCGLKLYGEEVQNACRKCFHRFDVPQRLASTPLLANGEFSAGALIGDPLVMSAIVQRFADLIEQIRDGVHGGVPPAEIRLLAASRSGAALAFCLLPFTINSGIEGVDIIDRLGPDLCLVEEYSASRRSVRGSRFHYIYVGDFVVAGTELRVAKAHLNERGHLLSHALCIGCVLPPDALSNVCTVVPIINLTELGLGLRYELLA